MKQAMCYICGIFILTAVTGTPVFAQQKAAVKESVQVSAQDKQAAEEAISQLPHEPEAMAEPAEYSSNVVVMKLKDGVRPEEILQQAGINTISIEEVKYSLPSEKLVEAGAKKQTLEKNSDGWYWCMGKNYKDIDEIEKDNFSLGYSVNLVQGTTAGQVISTLRDHPGVEYVMPGHYAIE